MKRTLYASPFVTCPNSAKPQQKLVGKSNKGDILKYSVSLAEHFPRKYKPNG